MKLFGKIMAVIGSLVGLLLLLILACHLNPGLAEKIGNLLGGNHTALEQTLEELTTEAGNEEAVESSMLTSDMLLGISGEANPVESPETSEDSGNVEHSQDGLAPDQIVSDYIPPEDDSLDVPQILAGLTGFEPVQDTGEEITQPEAEQLKDELGYGNTGDGLTFDAVTYPYYQMLDDTGKHLYRQIYANANDLTKAFVPVETTSQTVLKNAFTSVCNDHPELFWVDTAYTFQYTPSGTARMDLQFNQTANNLDQSKSEFESKAQSILDQASGLNSDYDKEVQVHDDLIKGITYHLNAPMNQSAYSALVNGQTVCAGYARAYQYLLQQLSIPCYYCTGYAGENHAWDIVKLDDGYYNVDPTWDDSNPNNYDYFNKTDADFSKDHARKDLSVYLPPCNGQKYRNLIQDETQEPASMQQLPSQDGQVVEMENIPVVKNEPNQNTDAASQKDSILTSMDEYYQNCYDQSMEADGTTITFTNTVENRKLAQLVYRAYQAGDYRDGYMLKVMQDKGFTQCTVDLSLQEQDDGTYVLTHTLKASK